MPRRHYPVFTASTWEALHWYALVVTDAFYVNWSLRDYLPFRPQFALASRAHAVVRYDRLINNEMLVEDIERLESTPTI